jgi:hypothetical protein
MVRRVVIGTACSVLFAVQCASAAEKAALIADVRLSRADFSPSNNEMVALEYRLESEAELTIQVVDPSHRIVRQEKLDARPQGPGRWEWDGRDSQGSIVPDEAYTFVLGANSSGGESLLVDARANSGGVLTPMEGLRFDHDTRRIIFRLSHPARACVRAGIKDGFLLDTVRDWVAMPAGENIVYWPGRNGEWDYLRMKGLEFRGDAWTLPDLTVLVYGTAGKTFREYLLETTFPKRPPAPRTAIPQGLMPRSRLPVEALWAPSFKLGFPYIQEESGGQARLASGESLLRIESDSPLNENFFSSLFEIVMLLDGELITEEGNGYLPYNWPWSHSTVPPGHHLLTINLSNFAGQIGSRSVIVEIRSEAEPVNSGTGVP